MDSWFELEKTIISCRKCPRLVEWREEVSQKKRRAFLDFQYWGKPVPSFGDYSGRLMIVGLAPGAHGSNRTGRMFTGDASGDFLYQALYNNGFANQPDARVMNDGLELKDVFISAVCRCVPPANKPTAHEIKNCLPYLSMEMDRMENLEGIIALGRVAFDNVIKLQKERGAVFSDRDFKHASLVTNSNDFPWILASYHPSRQNTQTGRLTVDMFDKVWKKAKVLLSSK